MHHGHVHAAQGEAVGRLEAQQAGADDHRVPVFGRGVAECAVIGVPDERSGEAVRLVIVKKDPNLTKEDILAWCKTQLTGYKRPHLIEFRDSLPKTPIGKIMRRELRDERGENAK